MIKYNTPQELFTAICDKIRDKTNSNKLINHQDIPDKIDNLVDTDIINEYNELLSMIINQNTIIELNNKEIENINICFMNCTNLTTVNLPECTSIGTSTFYGCTNLTTVNLPECTSIGDTAFMNCTNLTTVNLPECTSIGISTFNSCTNLTTVNLPKCATIGIFAFVKCTNLTTIILNNRKIVTLEDGAFNSSAITRTGYIYVPDNLVDSYKIATNWSTYANQIKPLSELPSELKEEYNYKL